MVALLIYRGFELFVSFPSVVGFVMLKKQKRIKEWKNEKDSQFMRSTSPV